MSNEPTESQAIAAMYLDELMSNPIRRKQLEDDMDRLVEQYGQCAIKIYRDDVTGRMFHKIEVGSNKES